MAFPHMLPNSGRAHNAQGQIAQIALLWTYNHKVLGDTQASLFPKSHLAVAAAKHAFCHVCEACKDAGDGPGNVVSVSGQHLIEIRNSGCQFRELLAYH